MKLFTKTRIALAALLLAATANAQSIPDPNPAGPPIALCQSAVAVTLTGTGSDTESVLATCSVPRKWMGKKGRLVARVAFTHTNSANNKTIKVRFNGIAGTAYLSQVNTTSATFSAGVRIANRGATNSQVGYVEGATPAYVTSSVDTTVAVPLVITGTLATTSESLVLESYSVELIPSK